MLKRIDSHPSAAGGRRSGTLEFGSFELNTQTGELLRNGVRVRLSEQPYRILAALLERPGELVTRQELRNLLWPEDTFVDFEAGLASAVKRVRGALNDSATKPRYVETLPKRGYRFIAEVRRRETPAAPTDTATRPGIPKPLLWVGGAAVAGTTAAGCRAPAAVKAW